MKTPPDISHQTLVPYIRLTKDENEVYTLWIAVFIPQNYKIKNEPEVIVKDDELVLVNIFVDGPKKKPSSKWEVVPFKVVLPTPTNSLVSSASIKTTVWLDDPDDEGSTNTKYSEAAKE